VELRLRDGSGHCENFTNEFGMWQVGKPAASNIYVVPLSFSDTVGAVYQGANELEWTTCLTSIVRFVHSFYDRAYRVATSVLKGGDRLLRPAVAAPHLLIASIPA